MEYFDCFSEKGNNQAQQFFGEAIKIDKAFALPYTAMGYTHMIELLYGWSDSPLHSFEESEKNVDKALALNDSLDIAHLLLGWMYLFKGKHDEAIREGERAIKLNPNGAEAHAQMGFILFCSGKTDLAIKLLKQAFRLNPIPPPHFYMFLAMAYRSDGQYEKAIKMSEKGLSGNPDHLTQYLILTASYISLNRVEEAHNTAEKVMRIDPNFSLEYYGKMLPYKHQETVDNYIDALHKAGLP